MRQRVFSGFCLLYGFLAAYLPLCEAQSKKYYWQQEVSYKMDVIVDVVSNRYNGSQTIKYRNNSPETLEKVYFHLYLNAFQPGSAMDIRARTQNEPDPKIGTRISRLKPGEIGYQKILKLTQDGADLKYIVEGTILEVKLDRPVSPGQSVKFEMQYEAQVPLQVRRTGRDNLEGIRYSMAQWYPKLCEYDDRGWHATPYIAREFYGVWGDYDVKITIDAAYMVAASGVLANANKIGHGYADVKTPSQDKLTWHFVAKSVHDFVWAADPDYTHDVHTCANGVVLHAFYQPHETFAVNWKKLLPIMEVALGYCNENFGPFPYPVYSFIQGGDGGMEYPMATLMTGNKSFSSLLGTSIHELMHSWYQMVLGLDESYYYWIDEGFANFGSQKVHDYLKTNKLIPGVPDPIPFESSYRGYKYLVMSGFEEPMSTHADHFENSSAYSTAAYAKGVVFLNQLEYVVGKPDFDKGILDFFETWKFKHPDDNDFIRIMEEGSGLELDWYKDYMVYSTKTIDYALDTMIEDNDKSRIILRRDASMPMPIDVVITLKDGTRLNYNIPLDIMRGAKKENARDGNPFQILADWDWANPFYQFSIPFLIAEIKSVYIDPSMRMADLNRDNNVWPLANSEN